MRGMTAVLERDVSATIIPSGDRVSLPAGSELRVMQTLGGNITVQDPYGQLFRIDEKDGGVLGEEYAPKEKALPEGGQRVDIQMTLTAPGCGMGPVLVDDVRQKVSSVPGVKEANIDLVWDPPWSQDRMTDVAKLQLGWM